MATQDSTRLAIRADALLTRLAENGVTRLAGVPCSSMTGLINTAQAGTVMPYANAPNEGEALAYAAGVWLGGGRGAVLCQNSGLGNLYNCLTSLCLPYEIPALILAGWRGMPGLTDEPQHKVMGAATPGLFSALGIHHTTLTGEANLAGEFDPGHYFRRQSLAILVAPNAMESAVADMPLAGPAVSAQLERDTGTPGFRRAEALAALAALAPAQIGIVVSTGLLSREFFALADRANVLSMAGSMGHAAPIALGIQAASGAPVLAIEGDGSVLMRPQGMGFVGSERPARFAHVVLDNGVHESTGGQPSLSNSIDLAAVAAAFGYRYVVDTVDPERALRAARRGLDGDGPVFIRLRIKSGGPIPPRITRSFPDMAARFRDELSNFGGLRRGDQFEHR